MVNVPLQNRLIIARKNSSNSYSVSEYHAADLRMAKRSACPVMQGPTKIRHSIPNLINMQNMQNMANIDGYLTVP
jgi:hypothetical protein